LNLDAPRFEEAGPRLALFFPRVSSPLCVNVLSSFRRAVEDFFPPPASRRAELLAFFFDVFYPLPLKSSTARTPHPHTVCPSSVFSLQ